MPKPVPVRAPAQYTCHRAAVFSDIHSNYHALKACFDDAVSNGADCFLFLGDYISGLSEPVKTLELVYDILSRYPTVCIRGNRERYMIDHSQGNYPFAYGSHTGSFLFTYNQLRECDHVFISNLPFYDVIVINGVTLELAHATKNSDRYYFEKDNALIDVVFSQMESSCLLTGHSHKQYIQSAHNKVIINAGSVGLPQGGNWHAQYALLNIDEGAVSCELMRVPYDLKAAIHGQFCSGLAHCAGCWAISELYGAITGEEYTKQLLSKMYRFANDDPSALEDEQLWRQCAAELGMHFTEKEILDFAVDAGVFSFSTPR